MFVAAIPMTYFAHMYKSPTSIYWQRTKPRGLVEKIDNIEEQESFGISRFGQFNWHDRLNFDACVECGDARLSARSTVPAVLWIRERSFFL